MHATATTLFENVRGYRPEKILSYLAEKEGIDAAEAQGRWEECLRFLSLAATCSEAIAPSEQVDSAWHAFLLHTQEYEEFCLTQLGTFVHHNPKPMPLEEFEASKRLIRQHFADSSVKYDLWEVGDCVAKCASKGCNKISVDRGQPLRAVVANGWA